MPKYVYTFKFPIIISPDIFSSYAESKALDNE